MKIGDFFAGALLAAVVGTLFAVTTCHAFEQPVRPEACEGSALKDVNSADVIVPLVEYGWKAKNRAAEGDTEIVSMIHPEYPDTVITFAFEKDKLTFTSFSIQHDLGIEYGNQLMRTQTTQAAKPCDPWVTFNTGGVPILSEWLYTDGTSKRIFTVLGRNEQGGDVYISFYFAGVDEAVQAFAAAAVKLTKYPTRREGN